MIYNKLNADYINNINLQDYNKINFVDEASISIHNSFLNDSIIIESLITESVNNKGKNFFRKIYYSIIKPIIDSFKKFTKFVEDAISLISARFMDNRKISEEYREKIINGFDLLKEYNKDIHEEKEKDKYYGLKYNSELIDEYSYYISEYAIQAQLKNLMESFKDEDYIYNDTGIFNTCRSNIIKSVLLDSSTDYGYKTVEEVRKHVENDIGWVEKVYLIDYYKSGDVLLDTMTIKNSKKLKNEYKKTKSIINKCIEYIDKFEYDLEMRYEKDENYDIENGKRMYSELSLLVAFIQNICQQIYAILIKARYEELNQARKFALLCIDANYKKVS